MAIDTEYMLKVLERRNKELLASNQALLEAVKGMQFPAPADNSELVLALKKHVATVERFLKQSTAAPKAEKSAAGVSLDQTEVVSSIQEMANQMRESLSNLKVSFDREPPRSYVAKVTERDSNGDLLTVTFTPQ